MPVASNAEWVGAELALYPGYRDALWPMRRDGIVAMGVACIWLELVEKKRYLDLTGNDLNRPNDFGYHVYGQVVWPVITAATLSAVGIDGATA